LGRLRAGHFKNNSTKTACKQARSETWDFNKVVDLAVVGREKCIKRLAPSAKKNAKFLLSRAGTVLYTAKNVSQNARKAAAKSEPLEAARQAESVRREKGVWFILSPR